MDECVAMRLCDQNTTATSGAPSWCSSVARSLFFFALTLNDDYHGSAFRSLL